jgi:transposase
MAEGTWVGLDVLARKVVAGVLDAGTGEVQSVRLPAQLSETVEWLRQLPAPVRVGYEAGPTGYGLARACAAAGIGCTVAAPSKIPRAPGDRVKTDRRDAERLARLLRLGELVAVRVPEPHEEAARDLLRAREDARGELMRARHRLSKLLLRHGMVYDASAWTLAHDAWLRRQRFESRPLGQPAAVRARADASARRLHQRWQALERRGKRRTVVAVAVARELAGHCWALATM